MISSSTDALSADVVGFEAVNTKQRGVSISYTLLPPTGARPARHLGLTWMREMNCSLESAARLGLIPLVPGIR